MCAAARRLNIGYVVDDSHRIWPGHNNAVSFAGLHDLGRLTGVPGLIPIGREGSVTVYRITGC
ncbi:hypothetical protein MM440_04840 [Arsenicicoccus piscis]|nr:DUF6541 family protein [Arsenicicoccus piscis]MCH8627128.1 hypothetical protein [Arsenicicoccus piscis]